MHVPIASQLGNVYQPKPNGKKRRAVQMDANIPGAMKILQVSMEILGNVVSGTGMRRLPLSAALKKERVLMACMIWGQTFPNGRQIGTAQTTIKIVLRAIRRDHQFPQR